MVNLNHIRFFKFVWRYLVQIVLHTSIPWLLVYYYYWNIEIQMKRNLYNVHTYQCQPQLTSRWLTIIFGVCVCVYIRFWQQIIQKKESTFIQQCEREMECWAWQKPLFMMVCLELFSKLDSACSLCPKTTQFQCEWCWHTERKETPKWLVLQQRDACCLLWVYSILLLR